MHELGEEKVNRYDNGPYRWFLPYFYAQMHERPLELLADLLKPTDAVLDLGCGDGRLTALRPVRCNWLLA